MFRSTSCIVATCLLLAHCAGSIKVMPEYKSINVEDSELGIILLKENIVIKNPNEIAEFLGEGEAIEVFHDFFTSQLMDAAENNGKFNKVTVITGCDTSGFTKSTQLLSFGDSVLVNIPVGKVCMSDSLPYLLILSCFDISRDQNPGTTMVTVGPYGTIRTAKVGARDNLVLTGTFVLWDNRTGKIVAFGKINEKTAVVTAMAKQTWITLVENISIKIFADTPYGMPSVPIAE